MALLNDIYIFVQDESLDRQTQSATHPVEKGIDITDHAKREPLRLSISGKIVMREGIPAFETLAQIEKLQNLGSLITYVGRNYCANMQIQSFRSDHPNTNKGGLDFDMDLVEIRVAKSAYVQANEIEPNNTTREMPPPAEIKVGSIVTFLGGSVFVSSGASNPAANRGRSQCEVTIINSSAHPLHCISIDGQMVYGWVDRANIEVADGASSLAGTANGGLQQVV